MFSRFLDFLFPPTCVGCETEGDYLCKNCKKELKSHSESCLFCHKGNPEYRICWACCSKENPLEGVVICFQYSGMIKKLILDLKFGHRSHVTGFLAQRLGSVLLSHQEFSQKMIQGNLVLSYIPSHWIRKYFVKGYNQSELLAIELGKYLGIPVIQHIKRKKYTRSQVKLSRAKRLTNLLGAFGGAGNIGKIGKNQGVSQPIDENITTILLVDDIVTTGSTLLEVAKEWKTLGPNLVVWGVVVARHGK